MHKVSNTIGKMALIDLFSTGLPENFKLKCNKVNTIERSTPVFYALTELQNRRYMIP